MLVAEQCCITTRTNFDQHATTTTKYHNSGQAAANKQLVIDKTARTYTALPQTELIRRKKKCEKEILGLRMFIQSPKQHRPFPLKN